MKKLLAILILALAPTLYAQTAWNITATPIAQENRPGIVPGGVTDYGPGSAMLRNMFQADGGDYPGYYNQNSWVCQSGTTSTWTSNYNDADGYILDFFSNPQSQFIFYKFTGSTPAYVIQGTGNITASTDSTTTGGITFTMSYTTGTPTACVAGDDMLLVLDRASGIAMSPIQLFTRTGASISSDAVWNTTDTSPASTNTIHSLQLTNGDHIELATDQGEDNATNPNPTLAAQQVNNINVNGTGYVLSFKYKCLGSGTTAPTVTFVRANGGATFVSSTATSEACNSTAGSGWNTFSATFNGTEDGTQVQGNLNYQINCVTSGTACLFQDQRVMEPDTCGSGTVFRCSFIQYLQAKNYGVLRWMDPSLWATDFADESGPEGNRRWANVSNYIAYNIDMPLGWDDMLSACDYLNMNCKITAGMFFGVSDWGAVAPWLSTNAHYISLKNKGLFTSVALGNEAFNAAAGGDLDLNNGTLYGVVIGPNVAAFRAGSGYDSTHMFEVGNCWWASGQLANFGWCNNVLSTASLTTNGRPARVEFAPYNFGFLSTYVGATGAPFPDMQAQVNCWDSSACGSQSMQTAVSWINTHFGTTTSAGPPVITDEYEVNSGLVQGTSTVSSQSLLNGVTDSVGEAEVLWQHFLLMMRDSGVTGSISLFDGTERFNGWNCVGGGCPSIVSPVWGVVSTPNGPGQSLNPIERSQSILGGVINNAIGNNAFLMSAPCTGSPTFAYPGGQPNGSNTIPAYTFPLVQCFAFSDQSGHWTGVIFNNNLTASESVTTSGTGAPGGVSGSQWNYPVSGENQTSNNEAWYIIPSSQSLAQDVAPAVVTGSISNSITVPAGGVWIGSWAAGTPTLAAPTFSPIAGTYGTTQSVTITGPGGATVCYTTDGTTPLAATAGTCSHGTTYSSAVSVSSSLTIKAISTEVSFLNSAVASAGYVIIAAASAPTFSPVAGTYTGSQSVTISTSSSGAIICYNTTGSPATNGSTGCTTGTLYTGAVTVASTETLFAVAGGTGFSDSTVASAAYTINTSVGAKVNGGTLNGVTVK